MTSHNYDIVQPLRRLVLQTWFNLGAHANTVLACSSSHGTPQLLITEPTSLPLRPSLTQNAPVHTDGPGMMRREKKTVHIRQLAEKGRNIAWGACVKGGCDLHVVRAQVLVVSKASPNMITTCK